MFTLAKLWVLIFHSATARCLGLRDLLVHIEKLVFQRGQRGRGNSWLEVKALGLYRIKVDSKSRQQGMVDGIGRDNTFFIWITSCVQVIGIWIRWVTWLLLDVGINIFCMTWSVCTSHFFPFVIQKLSYIVKLTQTKINLQRHKRLKKIFIVLHEELKVIKINLLIYMTFLLFCSSNFYL